MKPCGFYLGSLSPTKHFSNGHCASPHTIISCLGAFQKSPSASFMAQYCSSVTWFSSSLNHKTDHVTSIKLQWPLIDLGWSPWFRGPISGYLKAAPFGTAHVTLLLLQECRTCVLGSMVPTLSRYTSLAPSFPSLGSLPPDFSLAAVSPGAFSGPSRLEYVFQPGIACIFSHWSTDHNLFSLLSFIDYMLQVARTVFILFFTKLQHLTQWVSLVLIKGSSVKWLTFKLGVWGTEEWTLSVLFGSDTYYLP